MFSSISTLNSAIFSISKPYDIIDTTGLFLYYDMEANNVNSTLLINRANGGDATTINTPTSTTSFAKRGISSLNFTGASSQYAQLPNFSLPASTTLGNGFTVSFWFKTVTFAINTIFFDTANVNNVNSNTSQLLIAMNTSNKSLRIYANLVNCSYNNLPYSYADNNWHHVCLICTVTNTTSGLCTYNFYFDGLLQTPSSSTTDILYPGSLNRTGNKFMQSNFPSQPYYTGLIDEFRLYMRPITTTEINALYTPNDIIDNSGLLHYYDFEPNNISGTTLTNLAGGGNATLVNGVTSILDGKRGTSSINFIKTSSQSITFNTNITSPPAIIGNGFSIAFWFKTSAVNSGALFFYLNGYICYLTGTSQLSVVSSSGNVFTVGTFATNTWNHVCINIQVTGMGPDLCSVSLYYNGAFNATFTNQAYPTSIARNAYLGGSSYYQGQMDEFRYYQRVISSTEISTLYANI